MKIDFKGRTVIVTGAGTGLGRAHALGFARLGANVVVNEIGPEGGSAAAREVVAQIKALGADAFAEAADVSDFAQVHVMVERAETRWGGVDILVNTPASCSTGLSAR